MKDLFGSLLGTLVALLGVLGVAALMLCEVAEQRELARAESCGNNLKQLGLAMHNYHSAYNMLPVGSGGTDLGSAAQPRQGNANRLGPMVALTPFMEQQRLWEMISNPMDGFPAMGPVPWFDEQQYKPWNMRPETLACPSDRVANKWTTSNSYASNYGDGTFQAGAPVMREMPPYKQDIGSKRGLFAREQAYRFRDVLDGLSNTLLLVEMRVGGPDAKGLSGVMQEVDGITLNPSLVKAMNAKTTWWPEGRGMRWADGSLRVSGVQTVLPPNSMSATTSTGELDGILSAASHHPGGVHIAFGDGAVKFVSEKIDAGDPTKPGAAMQEGYARAGSRSPYGIWGAMGSRASRETITMPQQHLGNPVTELSETQRAEVAKRPLRDWTDATGQAKMKARFSRVVNQTHVELLLPNGQLQTLPLNYLRSEDAYFAVEQDAIEVAKQLKDLTARIEEGLKLLETRQFEAFAKSFVPPEALLPGQTRLMAERIRSERGNLIQMFDDALAGEPKIESSRDRVSFKTDGRRPSRFQKIDGQWYFQ